MVIGINIGYHIICLLNISEWASMAYIIYTQKGRSVGEILFDFNAENLNESNQFGKNYRKQEIKFG